MAIKILKEKNLSWINIDKLDEESLNYLKTNHSFHPLDYEDLQSESQNPKIDNYKNYLFLITHTPHWQAETKLIVPSETDIFIGENYLITIQYSKTKEMKNFFYRCMKNHKIRTTWMQHSSGSLLYELLSSLFNHTQPIVDNMGRQISFIENHIFKGVQHTTALLRELAMLRRNILHFRRIIEPQRYLIASLSHIRKPFLDENLSIYFDNISDYLNKLWAILDTYKETVDGLHEMVDSLITHRTNKVIGMLTMISVCLLPLALLSGIYGMNIEGLPYANKPIWVWTFFAVLITIILVSIGLMKKKKWL